MFKDLVQQKIQEVKALHLSEEAKQRSIEEGRIADVNAQKQEMVKFLGKIGFLHEGTVVFIPICEKQKGIRGELRWGGQSIIFFSVGRSFCDGDGKWHFSESRGSFCLKHIHLSDSLEFSINDPPAAAKMIASAFAKLIWRAKL